MEHPSPSQFEARKGCFGHWLLAQMKRDDDIGALAKVAFTDPRFPKEGDYKAASKYLNTVGASVEMHEALAEAEADWLAI